MRRGQFHQTTTQHRSFSNHSTRRPFTVVIRDVLKHSLPSMLTRRQCCILFATALVIIITLQPIPLTLFLPSSSLRALSTAPEHYVQVLLPASLQPPNNYATQLNALLSSSPHLTQNLPSSSKFILFRTIGNDLPPRHANGQSVRNLKFILENERPKPNLDVRWYINRIIDDGMQLKIVKLLVKHNQLFTIDFFNHSEYADVQFDFNIPSYDGTDVLRSSLFKDSPETDFKRLRVWDAIFQFKNQYIIRNNIVRNNLIQLGQTTNATYILPWDGNCFLTDNAWHNISSSIDAIVQSGTSNVSTRYFYVPMTRMTDNYHLKNSSFFPSDMDEEPQVIFHREAITRFDESKPYGYRPKVDLLWRLRIPAYQFVDKDGKIMRDAQQHKLAKDIPGYDSVRPVGWTARLYSGNRALEQDGAAVLRGRSRADGIEILTARAWLRVAQSKAQYSHTSTFFMYDAKIISKRLLDAANHTLHPLTAKRISKLVDTSQCIMRLRDKNLIEGSSKVSTETAHNLAIVTLAGLFSDDKRFLAWAAQRARRLMVEGETRAQASDVQNARDLINICIMLDASKMLNIAGGISSLEFDAVRAWAYEISNSLDENSSQWNQVYFSQDRDAVLFEAGAGCIHASAGVFHLAVRRLGLANGRLIVMAKDGGKSRFVEQEGLFGLEAWLLVAQMAARIGLDTWKFTLRDSDEPALPVMTRAALQVSVDSSKTDIIHHHCLLSSIAREKMDTSISAKCLHEVVGNEKLPDQSIMPPFATLALLDEIE